MKMKVSPTALLAAIAIVLMGTSGCASIAKGEVLEVEEDMGKDGPVLELEVAREASEGWGSRDTYEVHVDADSDCEVGDIYPDCDND